MNQTQLTRLDHFIEVWRSETDFLSALETIEFVDLLLLYLDELLAARNQPPPCDPS